jgi:adenylate cyclase
MDMTSENAPLWRSILTEKDSPVRKRRRLLRVLPSSPRCKLCNLPFSGVGGLAMRLAGSQPAAMNPRFCNSCFTLADRYPGGAEIELSMLFADIRGSTGLAERLGTVEFSRLVGRFYDAVTGILVGHDALIDRLIGDEVIALFIPLFSGADHARRAVQAAQEILQATGHAGPGEPWVPVGAGVHTGTAYVGSVGSQGVTDFTALGDNVNATARLASLAGAGEILVSRAALEAGRLQRSGLESRDVALKGREAPMSVAVLRV